MSSISRSGMSFSEAGKLGSIRSTVTWKKKRLSNIKKYKLDPKRCLHCKEPMPYDNRRNKFCSHSCSAIFNNSGVVRNGFEISNKICKNCGKSFKPHGSNVGTYCSHKCQGEYKWNKTKQKITKQGWYSTKNSHTVRKYLRETKGWKCEICHRKDWMGKEIPLVLDHINGNPEDDKISNLRLVCGNCDMQLPTYKSKNKGNGRACRRQRYKEGKSY